MTYIVLTFYGLSCCAQTNGNTVQKSMMDPSDMVSSILQKNPVASTLTVQKNTNELPVASTASISPELEKLIDEITKPVQPFVINGYVDCYYFKNLNNPKNGSNTGISGAARAFDQKENQFQIGLAQTKFSWNKKKADAVIDLTFGPHADLGNYGNKIGPLGVNIGSTALSIKQAYVTYKLNRKNSLTMGQFGTHIGYEVIESSVNYHYSLSNLFNNGPFYHQGLKYTHIFGDKLSTMVGIVNNWDNLYDNNRFKTAVAQICFTPKTGYSFYLNYIGGNENDSRDSLQNLNLYDKNNSISFKQLLDVVVNMQVTKRLGIGLNAAVGSKNNKLPGLDSLVNALSRNNWGGIAAYLTYTCTPVISLGLRGEFFDNTSGIQYIGNNNVQSYTATFCIRLDEDLLLKPECRMDIYKFKYAQNGVNVDQQFMDSSGGYTKNNQLTIGAACIFKF